MSAPTGWYPDPAGTDALRWWDGTSWTAHLAPAGDPAHGPRRRRGWALWALAVAATFAASLLALSVVVALDAAGCGAAATARERATGLRDLAGAALLLALPWAVAAAVRRPPRRRVLVGAAVGVSPLVLYAVTHLTVASWVGGACLF